MKTVQILTVIFMKLGSCKVFAFAKFHEDYTLKKWIYIAFISARISLNHKFKTFLLTLVKHDKNDILSGSEM